MLLRLIFSFSWFLGSLALGWWCHRQRWLSESMASRLVRFTAMGPSAVVLCFSFWKMNLRSIEPWLLPFLALVTWFLTQLPSLLYARHDRLSNAQTGSFLTCAFFSNLGYLGAFTAFALYGEAGYALCMLYLVFFTPCFYTYGLWVGSRYGGEQHSSTLAAAFNSELRLYPFLGMVVGGLLSLARVPRPDVLEYCNHALISANTGLYLIAIGSQLTFESPRPWLRPCLAMSAIKFLYTPLVAWGLLALFRIQGLPRAIMLLEACTPVAVSPLVLPLLFGLDRRLANALWLFTTLVSIPWFALMIPILPRL